MPSSKISDGYFHEVGSLNNTAGGYPTPAPPEKTPPPTIEHEVPQNQQTGMHLSTVDGPREPFPDVASDATMSSV